MKIYESKVGPTIDVATPAEKKLKALAAVWILCALLPLSIINYAIYDFLIAGGTLLSTSDIVTLLGFILMPFLFWTTVATARHRVSAAKTKDRYFRAGPGGVSICIAKNDSKTIFLFGSGSQTIDLPWSEIQQWYPYTLRINFVPAAKTIVFRTVAGKKIEIPMYNFDETQTEIVKNISNAVRTLRPQEQNVA